MIESRKVNKLIPRLQRLAAVMDRHHDLVIHQRVNQFYYMQKSEELKVLLEQLEEARQKLENVIHRIDLRYTEAFHQWNKDARWLNLRHRDTNI